MKKNLIIATAMAFSIGSSAYAQAPMIYPSKGQSPEKMDQDKNECYGWAKTNSGFDPVNPPTSSGPAATAGANSNLGNAAGSAARGAALGAIGGAIAGDAGQGAAIGAAVAGAGGLTRNRRLGRKDQAAQQQHAQQEAAHIAQLRSQYDKAYAVCLEGRGYAVK